MSERFEQMAASRPGPFVPRRNWGDLWHSFNYAWHYDRTDRPGLRDYWLGEVVKIVEFRKSKSRDNELLAREEGR